MQDTPEVAEARADFLAHFLEWMAMLEQQGHDVLPVIPVEKEGDDDGAGDFEVVESASNMRYKRAPDSDAQPEADADADPRHGYYMKDEMEGHADDQIAMEYSSRATARTYPTAATSYTGGYYPQVQQYKPMMYQPFYTYYYPTMTSSSPSVYPMTKKTEMKKEKAEHDQRFPLHPLNYAYDYNYYPYEQHSKSSAKKVPGVQQPYPYQPTGFVQQPYDRMASEHAQNKAKKPLKMLNYYLEDEEQMKKQQKLQYSYQSPYPLQSYPTYQPGKQKTYYYTKPSTSTYYYYQPQQTVMSKSSGYHYAAPKQETKKYTFSPVPTAAKSSGQNKEFYYSMPHVQKGEKKDGQMAYQFFSPYPAASSPFVGPQQQLQTGFGYPFSSIYPTRHQPTQQVQQQPGRFFRRPEPASSVASAPFRKFHDGSVPNIPEVDQPAAEAY